MAHIVIISSDKLFAESLSDIISRELGALTTTMEDAQSFHRMSDVDLVVSTEELSDDSCRTMRLQPGEPRKIKALLSEIALHLSDKSHAPIMLASTIYLHDKPRKLERSDTGISIELTEKELSLLMFIKSEGEAARDDILKNVWGFSSDVTTHTLDTHLYRLRQKWREIADYDCIIATNGGYRWYDAS